MFKYKAEVKQKVLALRQEGKTYSEIRTIIHISKATLSLWCKNMELTDQARTNLDIAMKRNLVKARAQRIATHRVNRAAYLKGFYDRNKHYASAIEEPVCAKIALAMLYAGEGSKNMSNPSFRFANSDPRLIRLFLKVLRKCYIIDDAKFRCTVQCRADQDTRQLEQFWYNVTGIPEAQFYKTRIDPRTVGQISQKPEYKGVCVVEYFSTEYFFDLMKTIEVITGP